MASHQYHGSHPLSERQRTESSFPTGQPGNVPGMPESPEQEEVLSTSPHHPSPVQDTSQGSEPLLWLSAIAFSFLARGSKRAAGLRVASAFYPNAL